MGMKKDVYRIGSDFTKGLRRGAGFKGLRVSTRRRVRGERKDFLPKPKFGNFDNLF